MTVGDRGGIHSLLSSVQFCLPSGRVCLLSWIAEHEVRGARARVGCYSTAVAAIAGYPDSFFLRSSVFLFPQCLCASHFRCSQRSCRCCVVILPAPHSYSKAFFGPDGGWETALERFLQAPPNGTKDRAAMRDVTSLLVAGADHMCPRGFQVLADAAEVRCSTICSSNLSRRGWCCAGHRWGSVTAVNTRKGMTGIALRCLEDDVSTCDASVVAHSMMQTRCFHTGALTVLIFTATGHRTCWPVFVLIFPDVSGTPCNSDWFLQAVSQESMTRCSQPFRCYHSCVESLLSGPAP